ncbi:TIGR03085 family metal-binding protein [Rhodococcus sp. NPDC127528]|uniref:TIGR03085 family metal-binding protein n=1 Tax=unclassified Rhodococcus (in: high G+C Gram-positive bacteria) TaxID=192944 RepID=UPI00363DCB76
MSMAHDERLALVDTMTRVGPDAPTLCGEWTVRDLAAHLVLRERRLDAAPGITIAAIAPYTERVQASIATRPFPDLLDLVRTGPPLWSPMRPLDAVLNFGEMFIHHEDVRRAGPAWEPRELDAPRQDAVWAIATRMGRMTYRKAPCTVVLVRPTGERAVVHRSGGGEVVLRGEPAELALHAFGRDAVRLEADGPAAAVAAVSARRRSI